MGQRLHCESRMISFVTTCYNGWRPDVYKPEHVQRLLEMLKRYYKKPFRFYCVSDQELNIPGVAYVPIWESPVPMPKYIFNCYFRLFYFSGQATKLFGQRIVSIDLDTLILRSITHLFGDEPFKICKGTSNPYNGSMWQVQPGKYPELWADLTPELAKKANRQEWDKGRRLYGSDQAIMAYRLPRSPMWDESDGVYQYRGEVPDDARIVFFTGQQKPWHTKYAPLYWGDSKLKKHA